MYVLALNGSHHKEGNTAYLLNRTLEACAEMGAETELLSLHQIMNGQKCPFCVACSSPCDRRCYRGTELEQAYEKVTRADAVIFGSPVYFGSMTAQMKAFFDKTRYVRAEKSWIGKPAAAIAVGGSKYGGQENTISAIHSVLLVEGMTILGDGHPAFGAGNFGVPAQNPADKDEFAKQKALSLARRIMELDK